MKAILILAIVALGITDKTTVADENAATQEDKKPQQFQKLGLKNSSAAVPMSDEEAAKMNKQAIEGF